MMQTELQGKVKIAVIQQHAKNYGGKLLSTTYKNNKTMLLWECEKGHQWQAKWNMISSQKCWCPECSGLKKLDISILQQHAIKHSGKLLNTERPKSREKLLWECKEGHQWLSVWGHIQQGHWCPTCAGYFTTDIKSLQKHALDKGGKLLSTEYKNNKVKLLWQCKEGHQWQAKWTDIKSKSSWCPKCLYKTENICRTLLETVFNISFKKLRIYYNKHKFFEFDGYNEEHKIAFEYHGYQHYKYPNFFHKTEELFKAAQQRDKEKEQYCIDNNIKLIIVPYTIKSIEKYINNKASRINNGTK